MIDLIDLKIRRLLEIRDNSEIINNPELRASICGVIEKAYFLEKLVLSKKTFNEPIDNQFFISNSSVNRFFREWNLDEVADIYNELSKIAKAHILNM